MTDDPRAQLRDYVDGLTRQVLDGSPALSTPRPPSPRAARRRGRVLLAAMAVVLVASAAVFTAAGGGSSRRVVAAGGEPFVPPVSIEGGKVHMPIVFPDGSSVELAYPGDLDVAGLGFYPEAAVHYAPYGEGPDRPDRASASPCCDRRLTIERGTIRQVMGGRTPTKVYRGARGHDVLFFDSTAVDPSLPDFPQLAFQFGGWTVLAFDYPASEPSRGTRMTDQQRAVFAASLDGREDGQGFLRLEPRRPLCLQTVIDGPNGALGGDGPSATRTIWFYLAGLPRVPGGVVPDRLEASFSDALRPIQDRITMVNVRQDTQWRC
ncbi:MAG: hypothetical protein M3066_19240 [Actinomycetota bacterium]|nr:hypothetical protein [Actinomycetota bacterium]